MGTVYMYSSCIYIKSGTGSMRLCVQIEKYDLRKKNKYESIKGRGDFYARRKTFFSLSLNIVLF